MKIENIFRKISTFEKLEMDTILFEAKYPVLFTCIVEKEVYLFSCYSVNAKAIKWIGTKTNYETLLDLLRNKITIRDAFLSVTNTMVMIQYDGKEPHMDMVEKNLVPSEFLPTVGEYMDAEEDEYSEEIAAFELRNRTIEFKISLPTKKLYRFSYKGVISVLPDAYFANEESYDYGMSFGIKKVAYSM